MSNQPSNKTRRKPKALKIHKPKKESTKTIMNRLYRAWSDIVHLKAGNKCEVCGAEGKLDAHHLQPRQICSGLRFEPANGILLCSSHHKYGHESAHKGMLWFVDWLQKNKPEQFKYVMDNRNSVLDCKDRAELYKEEAYMHAAFERYIGKLPVFNVLFLNKDGTTGNTLIKAYNKKAAESQVFNKTIKGIINTEELDTDDKQGSTSSTETQDK